MQEKELSLISKREQLISKLKDVSSGVKFGALPPTSEKVIEVEKLEILSILIKNIRYIQSR